MTSPSLSPDALSRILANPVELAIALPRLRAAEVAAACDRMPPDSAAHVIAALPPELAARVLDDLALTRPEQVVEHLNERFLAPLLDTMSSARRLALFRATSAPERARLEGQLHPAVRHELSAARGTATDTATATSAQRERRESEREAAEGRISRWLWPLLAVVLTSVALLTLRHELRAYGYRQIMHGAATIPNGQLALAVLLTAVGYAVLAGYDTLALEYVGNRIPPARTLFASFIAYAMSQNAGFAAVTGASIRYRFWSSWGLSAPEIAQGVAFTTVTFWVGVLTIGGATFLFGPYEATTIPGLTPIAFRAIGAVLLALVAAYLAWTMLDRRVMTIRGWAFSAPRPSLAFAQVIVSTVDWVLAGLVLYALLPHPLAVPLLRVMGVFLLAQIAGLVSHVPGGIGVFEAVVILLLKPFIAPSQLVAALLVYRATYYLLPLSVAVIAFGAYEALLRRAHVARVVRVASRWVPASAPFVLSATTFAAGVVLLASGATPSLHPRLHVLHSFLPLGVLEVSHFTASIAGIALVLLARGVRQRLDAAWHLTIVVLGIGIVASLLKGLDYEEAILLAIALGAVLPARRSFYRRAALFSDPFSPAWTAAVFLVLAGTAWLGFFSYKHVDYSSDLWWHFALRADAPRFLRAMVGSAVFTLSVALWRLIRPAPAETPAMTATDMERTREIIAHASQSSANLALLGDKSLFFGEGGGFVMYGVEGRSWVALGDPVAADDEERTELAWRFREEAVRHGGRPVFYQVTREHLPLYVDLGLTLLKLGEAALVPLPTFSLEGPERRTLRRAVKEAEKAGCTFEMLAPQESRGIMPELRAVSDAWLELKRTREKGFSLGRFDEDYLVNFPIAVVRQHGRVIAFANIWTTATKSEVSVDLMRHVPHPPNGIMDFLFAQLMLWARDQGYERFDLGMAPMSGFEARALAPSWNRVGRAVFKLGEHFYNFQGLRRYKEKFRPVWEPRYLAAPGGLQLPRVLTNVASLISGGLTGVIAK